MSITLDGSALSISDVVRVARDGAVVRLAPAARDRIAAARIGLETVLGDGDLHYGVNTGFGSLSRTRIAGDDLRGLQTNLIRSHAAGFGDPLPAEVVRAMLVILAASLSRGRSGVRPQLVEQIIALLNAGITPVVPETGSVGASGDLAPLAHAALVLMGEGTAELGGQAMPGADTLAKANLRPITLEAKEGLALINGTHLMTARFALIWSDLDGLFTAAVTAAGMSIDACRATDAFLDPRVYEARNQSGATYVAGLLRERLEGSQIIVSHIDNDPRVQDPYSFRCAPIVLGAVRDALLYARDRLDAELGAVTDNPLVFPGEGGATDILSAGNFHGMPVALPLDVCAVTIAHLAGIAERRVYHMLSAFDDQAGLPAFLSPQPGLHSGLMIVQYAAAAACNELIGLAGPASVVNIGTCAGMEDYNSWGPRSAAKAARGVQLARRAVAIELLCAAQAIETHRPLRTGDRLERAHRAIRRRVPILQADRSPTPDIEAIAEMIAAGAFSEA